MEDLKKIQEDIRRCFDKVSPGQDNSSIREIELRAIIAHPNQHLYALILERLKEFPFDDSVTAVGEYKKSGSTRFRSIINLVDRSTQYQQKRSLEFSGYESLQSFDTFLRRHFFRLNLAIETTLSSPLPTDDLNGYSYRFRRSFRSQYFVIDVTKRYIGVSMEMWENQRRYTPSILQRTLDENVIRRILPSPLYEVEIEIIGENLIASFGETMRQFDDLFKKIFATRNVYSKDDLSSLNEKFGSALSTRKSPSYQLTTEPLVKLRNLKVRDLVDGGLISSSRHRNMEAYPYSVTFKADGDHRMILINEVGIWSVYPPIEYNLLFRWAAADIIHIRRFYGVVFEAEQLAPHNNQLPFLLFDCIAFPGKENESSTLIQGYPHLLPSPHGRFPRYKNMSESMTRYSHVENFLRTLSQITISGVIFSTKKFIPLLSVEGFYSAMQSMSGILRPFNRSEDGPKPSYLVSAKRISGEGHDTEFATEYETEYEYNIDGLVFTPAAPYNPRSARAITRTLSKTPDVCKWKPTSLLTIDFLYATNDESSIDLLSFDHVLGYVPFRGDGTYVNEKGSKNLGLNINPMTSDMVDFASLENVPLGSIVEMRWDAKSSKLVYYRTREEKGEPNSLEVAVDNWVDIHSPLRLETLLGETFELVFRYHNRIKNQLLKSVITPRDVVLDIGAGMGGDIAKLRSVAEVYAVEPNPTNLLELRNRLSKMTASKYTIIEGEGQDTEKILQAMGGPSRASVIILMLSLSFFWESREILENLIATLTRCLAPGGRILFLTQCGDAIEAAAFPVLGGVSNWQPQNPEITLDNIPAQSQIQTRHLGSEIEFTLYPRVRGHGRRLDVTIPGIVGTQTEYLVHLRDLILLLRPHGINLQYVERAMEETFMSPFEREYSSYYSYGSFVSTKTEIPSEEMLRVLPGTLSDDEVADLPPYWLGESLKRVGSIADANGILHPFLKATDAEYARANTLSRVALASNRRLLPRGKLGTVGAASGLYIWAVVDNGTYAFKLIDQIADPALIELSPRLFTLVGVDNFLASPETFESFDLDYFATLMKTNVILLAENEGNPRVIWQSVSRPGMTRTILILQVPSSGYFHYDLLLASRTIDGKQGWAPYLSSDDPLLQRIHERYPARFFDPSIYDKIAQRIVAKWGSSSQYSTDPAVAAKYNCLTQYLNKPDNPEPLYNITMKLWNENKLA